MAGEPIEVGQYVSLARKALVNEPYLANAAIIGELTKLTLARSGHSTSHSQTKRALLIVYCSEEIRCLNHKISKWAQN